MFKRRNAHTSTGELIKRTSADIMYTYLTHIAASRITHSNRRHKLGHAYQVATLECLF